MYMRVPYEPTLLPDPDPKPVPSESTPVIGTIGHRLLFALPDHLIFLSQ
ncbi:MAG: hypothetical protein KatS3mg111_1471 [Pirellulaceae bacterium]|nr:MAG: hypothetical protein KatS3mg111_1471 [Pirellulaceae bacterium]